MTRKLATIDIISDLYPIEGADKIETAVVRGWTVVVRKGEFSVGQKVIYFEIDSFLPQLPQFEFLAKSSSKCMNGIQGYRLRTIKLRGQLSQGLILPLSSFRIKGSEGDDLTEKLGVKLYEVTKNNITIKKAHGLKGLFYNIQNRVTSKYPNLLPLFQKIDGFIFKTKFAKSFPSFIKKTDQERIQNLSNKLEELTKHRYEISIKLDGSSMTVFRNNKDFGICSRNLDVTGQDDKYNQIDKQYGILNALKEYPMNIAIQGEMIGEGIQGNNEKIEGIDFYVFDIFDIDNQRYFNHEERLQILEDLKIIGCELKHVPVLPDDSIEGMNLQDILKMAEGESLFAKNREGLVFKSKELINGRIVSFKAISNKYLLAEKD